MIKEEPSKDKKPKEKDLIEDEKFCSHESKFFLVFFSQMKLPTKKIQIYHQIIILMRSFSIAVSVFGLINIPFLQVGSVMIIEGAFFFYLCKYSNKNDIGENLIDKFNSGFNLLYVIMKFCTLFSMTNELRQYKLGVPMAILILVSGLVNILYVIYCLFMMIVDWAKSIKKKSEEKKVEEVWYETTVYEYRKEEPVPVMKKKILRTYEGESMALRVARHYQNKPPQPTGFNPHYPSLTLEEWRDNLKQCQENVKKNVDAEKELMSKMKGKMTRFKNDDDNESMGVILDAYAVFGDSGQEKPRPKRVEDLYPEKIWTLKPLFREKLGLDLHNL